MINRTYIAKPGFGGKTPGVLALCLVQAHEQDDRRRALKITPERLAEAVELLKTMKGAEPESLSPEARAFLKRHNL